MSRQDCELPAIWPIRPPGARYAMRSRASPSAARSSCMRRRCGPRSRSGAGRTRTCPQRSRWRVWPPPRCSGFALVWRIDHVVGALVLPLAAIAALVPMAWPGRTIPAAAASAHIHAAISILTWAVLSLAALQALLLAWQERRLRTRRPGGVLRSLASLDTQERWLFRLVGTGFFLLSLSLASGFMFVQDMLAQHLAHKTLLSCLAWALFGALLWGRWRHGWRGQTAVRWCLSGFVVLALAYFGSRLILEGAARPALVLPPEPARRPLPRRTPGAASSSNISSTHPSSTHPLTAPGGLLRNTGPHCARYPRV